MIIPFFPDKTMNSKNLYDVLKVTQLMKWKNQDLKTTLSGSRECSFCQNDFLYTNIESLSLSSNIHLY